MLVKNAASLFSGCWIFRLYTEVILEKMENILEATVVCWGYIGMMWGLYGGLWGHVGRMEKERLMRYNGVYLEVLDSLYN